MYDLYIKPTADRIFKRLVRKDKKQMAIILKKLKEVRENPRHGYKHLRKPLEDFNRVHIDGNFVLIFSIDHAEQSVTVYYYGHHDSVYNWRPRSDE